MGGQPESQLHSRESGPLPIMPCFFKQAIDKDGQGDVIATTGGDHIQTNAKQVSQQQQTERDQVGSKARNAVAAIPHHDPVSGGIFAFASPRNHVLPRGDVDQHKGKDNRADRCGAVINEQTPQTNEEDRALQDRTIGRDDSMEQTDDDAAFRQASNQEKASEGAEENMPYNSSADGELQETTTGTDDLMEQMNDDAAFRQVSRQDKACEGVEEPMLSNSQVESMDKPSEENTRM